MCFDIDSEPPVPPVSGASIDTARHTLTAADGVDFAAFEARGAGDVDGPAVVVLPDVRGLYAFYEDLAIRLAEQGYDSLAIDYFGRTAGVSARDDDFDYMPHVYKTTFAGVSADVAAAVAFLRKDAPDRPVFTIGFCFGGSNSWHMAANDLGLAGAIGFYGHPDREFPEGSEPLTQRTDDMSCAILGLMGGDDPGIPLELSDKFREALTASGVAHEIVVYPGAPHSFFDRKYEEFADASADAWSRVLAFLSANST